MTFSDSIYHCSALLEFFPVYSLEKAAWLAAMCNRIQLDLINFLLYTFIVSALLAWGKWNRENSIKGMAHFCWTVKRQTKQAVWQRPGSGFPRVRQCWGSGSYRRFLGMRWHELLPRHRVSCLSVESTLRSNSMCQWFLIFVLTSLVDFTARCSSNALHRKVVNHRKA